MSLARPVFLKAIEFVAFFAFFHLNWHLKVIQPFQIYAKTFYLRQAFKQKNRLEIALQVLKLGFSPSDAKSDRISKRLFGLAAYKCLSPSLPLPYFVFLSFSKHYYHYYQNTQFINIIRHDKT